jgi:hypothetical protein
MIKPGVCPQTAYAPMGGGGIFTGPESSFVGRATLALVVKNLA